MRITQIRPFAALLTTAVVISGVLVGAAPAGAQELPASVLFDKHKADAERRRASADHAGAAEAYRKLLALGLETDHEVWFLYGSSAFRAGEHEQAVKALTTFLASASRTDPHYQEAIDLLLVAEDRVAGRPPPGVSVHAGARSSSSTAASVAPEASSPESTSPESTSPGSTPPQAKAPGAPEPEAVSPEALAEALEPTPEILDPADMPELPRHPPESSAQRRLREADSYRLTSVAHSAVMMGWNFVGTVGFFLPHLLLGAGVAGVAMAAMLAFPGVAIPAALAVAGTLGVLYLLSFSLPTLGVVLSVLDVDHLQRSPWRGSIQPVVCNGLAYYTLLPVVWLNVDHVNKHVDKAFDKLFWDPPTPPSNPGQMGVGRTKAGTMLF